MHVEFECRPAQMLKPTKIKSKFSFRNVACFEIVMSPCDKVCSSRCSISLLITSTVLSKSTTVLVLHMKLVMPIANG